MTNEVPYHFGLRIRDREIQIGGDKIFVETQAEKWLQIFANDLPPDLLGTGTESVFANSNPAARPQSAAAAPPPSRRMPTLGDFIKTKEPKEIGDMVLVIGLYLERFKQMTMFTRSDLMNTQIFQRLGKSEEEVQSSLVELVNKTFLNDSATMGSSEMSYSLTFTGEQVVKEGFNR